MAVDVLTEIVIDAPCDVVAAYAADPSNAPEWYANIVSVEWQTPPPSAAVEVGSRVTFIARFLGRRWVYTYEIVAYEPEQRLVMRATEGPYDMETTYTWEPYGSEGTRTRMTLRNRGGPGHRFAEPAVRYANRKDLRNLKALLEWRMDPDA
ncbi:SRPBCC family protein [Streptomyces sp. NPDC003036]|uniref:SRPBCC family protein n=1 Tax=Streptomyces sp. NPDC003036 TaxID=3154442 RepID=UPI0033B6A833